MTKISLSDFVDYISKSGTAKFSKIKEIERRDDYHPAFDFWKPLRDKIIELHQLKKDKKYLDEIISELTDTKKLKSYPKLIKQYKSFLGRKKISWFEPPNKKWKYKDLSVSLNPELGLEINNEFYIIKLWFKSEKLSKSKVDLILLLMNEKLGKKKYKGIKFAVLDIPNKKLFSETKLTSENFVLLEAEAESFLKIWSSVSK